MLINSTCLNKLHIKIQSSFFFWFHKIFYISIFEKSSRQKHALDIVQGDRYISSHGQSTFLPREVDSSARGSEVGREERQGRKMCVRR